MFSIPMFSQNQEDKMIQAVFGRIGVKTRKFVEFGFGFLQNNTLRFALRHRAAPACIWTARKKLQQGETSVSRHSFERED